MNDRHHIVESYHRQRHFDFWAPYRNPFYAVTFDLDITRLKTFADERGDSIYLDLCYFTIRAMRAIEDFRYRLVDGRIVLYDELHPGLTMPAPGNRFSFANLEYHPDLATFHERARPIVEASRKQVDLTEPENRNWVYFTALPGVPFTSFTHATNQPTDAAPQVAFGKFSQRDGRLTVPVGIQVNHLFIDGNALGELYEGLKRLYDEPTAG